MKRVILYYLGDGLPGQAQHSAADVRSKNTKGGVVEAARAPLLYSYSVTVMSGHYSYRADTYVLVPSTCTWTCTVLLVP